MRIAVIFCLFLAAQLGATDKVRFDSKDLVPKQPSETYAEDLQKRCLNGLLIRSFYYTSQGWAYIQLSNTGTSSQTFDFHQMRGLEHDTGAIVEAGSVEFSAKELASYSLAAGEARTFHVQFAGRKIAGVAWNGQDTWQLSALEAAELVDGKDAALEAARRYATAARLAKKKSALQPVGPSTVQK